MNILHLKYVVCIAENGSINKAAEELHVAQPNLSRVVKEMEADLGIRFFRRSSKGMMLTADGEWDSVYNVGWNRQRYTLVELAQTVADAAVSCGYPRPAIELEEADIALWAGMDSSRFMKKTGWKPEVTLFDSLCGLLRSSGGRL